MHTISTRHATVEDLPSVLNMIHALAAHHQDVASATLATLERDLTGADPWLTLLVAVHAERVVGYAALCRLAQLQFGVRGMDIHHLFVDPSIRRQGAGRALIQASVDAAGAAGCAFLTVGTHPDNQLAAQIYRAAGFDDLPPAGPRFRMRLTESQTG